MWVLGPHHTADAPLKVPTPGTLHSPPRVAMGPETTRERQLVAPLGTAGGWCPRGREREEEAGGMDFQAGSPSHPELPESSSQPPPCISPIHPHLSEL